MLEGPRKCVVRYAPMGLNAEPASAKNRRPDAGFDA
jgi:hypothetical protein